MTDTPRAGDLRRVVLAHSGALDTARAIPWLAADRGADVVTVTIDLGQKKEWLEEVRDRALATGAVRAHVVDVRDEFAREYLIRGLKAGLLSRDPVAMKAELASPLVARTLISIARIEQARTIAHGDPEGAVAPLARTVSALDSSVTLLAVPAAMTTPGGDNSEGSRAAAALPAEPAYVDIAFERGSPTGVNGVAMPWADLVGSLEIIARAHGVGPSALVLLDTAHRALRHATLSAEVERFSAHVADEYRRMLRDGSWFSPMRSGLDAYVDTVQQRAGGVVRLELFNGRCTVVDSPVATRTTPTIIPVTKS